jgi:hypothetical protein
LAIILPANTLAAGGFSVDNSCRFNDGDSANISRTLGTPSNADRFTLSMWIKRGSNLGAEQPLFVAGSSSSQGDLILFRDTGQIEWQMYHGSTTMQYKTNRVFRDVSAWYHFVFTYDSGNGTAGDRQRIYVNGVEETSFATSTDVAVNTDSKFNSALAHGIGYDTGLGLVGSKYFDGYMAEVVLCDGQAYAASDFGEYDDDSPTIWKPKDVSGLTFGTNGFYLDFEDSANLGNDANGGTDWAENNIAATDQATDTPTNNFCTMNPLDNYYAAFTYSQGNCRLVNSTKGFATGTFGLTAGKWYWEIKPSAGDGAYYLLGIADFITQGTGASNYLGYTSGEYAYYAADGAARTNQNSPAYGDTYAADDIIGVYLDLDNSKLYFAKNGTVQNSGTGIDITAAASTTNGEYFPATGYNDASAAVYEHNFGGCPAFAISSGNTDANGYGNFEYDPSAGTFDSASKSFLAICTKNLAEYG